MNDASIIGLFWERSENAIKETDIKYGKLCNRLANNILNNISDAEECVNDSYLTVWNSIPDARPNNFSAFLCRIVKNLSFKKLEYLTAQKRKPEILISLNELNDCISSSANTEMSYDTAELSKIISIFLRKQNETHRNIFLRRYWYYDSVKNIAADYGFKEEKVSNILFNIRKKLKKHLETEGYYI
ncbi:MAG: sigma-70 family RNA polymerase sigma factor [Clostridia bacterium]|nr:sigma-70 family RNA polymerase sigma factor [Clostridia bacterium]